MLDLPEIGKANRRKIPLEAALKVYSLLYFFLLLLGLDLVDKIHQTSVLQPSEGYDKKIWMNGESETISCVNPSPTSASQAVQNRIQRKSQASSIGLGFSILIVDMERSFASADFHMVVPVNVRRLLRSRIRRVENCKSECFLCEPSM